MRNKIIILALVLFSCQALADDAADCQNAAGSLLQGVVEKAPYFKPGGLKFDPGTHKKVALSHTHLVLKADQDNQDYDVAIDNVFASGYDSAARGQVPPPYNTIKVGDKLELCGQLYTDGTYGIHWVHTNCGEDPTPETPNGWIKVVNGGQVGPNMADYTKYCDIWGNGGK